MFLVFMGGLVGLAAFWKLLSSESIRWLETILVWLLLWFPFKRNLHRVFPRHGFPFLWAVQCSGSNFYDE
jgi:hypothetical protein